jgi:TonB family protein
MNSSVNGTLSGLKRSAVFIGAISLFFFADSVKGQTGGSRSNTVGSSQVANDGTPQSRPRYDRLTADILSDTQGVDFAPYLKQALPMFRKLWISSLPEEVTRDRDSQTETVIRFTISQDGTISRMELVEASHIITVDRAAWGSITGVGQLPSLPRGFNGPSLILRIHFRVNPTQQ